MQFKLIIILFIFFSTISCKKENILDKTTREKIIGTWKFKETPEKLLNSWMGYCCEDRTVFSGKETLTYSQNGDFKIDTTKYGVWKLDSLERYIIIDMTSTGGYAIGMITQSVWNFEIIILNDTILIVRHDFYRFTGNSYSLEPLNK